MIDILTTFSDNQSIAAAAGNIISTNIFDQWKGASSVGADQLGNPLVRDIGRTHNVELQVQITETVTSGGAATLQVQLCESANADLSSPTVVCETAVLALATLAAGYRPRLALPAGLGSQRYLGLRYVIGTATTTAGKIHASLTAGQQTALMS